MVRQWVAYICCVSCWHQRPTLCCLGVSSSGRKCFWVLIVILPPPLERMNSVYALGAGVLRWSGWCLCDYRLGTQEEIDKLGGSPLRQRIKGKTPLCHLFRKTVPGESWPLGPLIQMLMGESLAGTVQFPEDQWPRQQASVPPSFPSMADWQGSFCRHSRSVPFPTHHYLRTEKQETHNCLRDYFI